MAAPNDSFEERNQPATPYRREEFRKQGQVALSRELMSVLLLGAVGVVLYFGVSSFLREFSTLSREFFVVSRESINQAAWQVLFQKAMGAWAWTALPVLGIVLIVGILGCAAQVGLHVTWEPLTPNWNRLNPVAGLQRMFSLRGLVEAIKAIFKLCIGLGVLWYFLKSEVGLLTMLPHGTTQEVVATIFKSVAHLFFLIIFVLLFLALFDLGYQKWQLEKEMRMTRRETKEEHKMREGDPLIKARIRGIQRRIARSRMMQDVPTADVVVTNPTHFAIALKYERDDMPAPRVVAKGAGAIAKKIKEIAASHNIPRVENKPLARTLFKQVEIGHFIPRELYKAVAEVLAYVYRLRRGAQAA